MNKKEVAKTKLIVEEMKANYANLSQKEKEELLRLRCRVEFITFAQFITNGTFKPFKVHRLICDFIQRVGDGDQDLKRSVISLPPRTGKSMLISKIFPAWQLGRNPRAQFIMSSYSLSLSTENSRAVLDLILTDKFKWVFPECDVNPKACNLTAIRTKKGGLIKTASARGNVTGFGFGDVDDTELPGIGILDDLLADGNSSATMESTFNWVQAQFISRALPNNAIISMGTRFHKDDIAGRLIAANPEDWKVLNVQAICTNKESDPLGRDLGESHWPEFFPVETLSMIRRTVGERDFSALYQGDPVVESGAIFKDYWFDTYDSCIQGYKFLTIDTAYKEKNYNDYSAICIWNFDKVTQRLYLMDYVLDRFDFPDLQRCVIETVERYKARAVYIEGRANGLPLIQTLRKFLKVSVKELNPSQDKVLRANSVAPLAENGLVALHENLKNIDDRINDLCSFPYIRNDDFVDAFVYGIIVARDELGVRVDTLLSKNPDLAKKPIPLFESPEEVEPFKVIGLQDKKIETKTSTRISTISTGRRAGTIVFR